jgi:hypothetical protein
MSTYIPEEIIYQCAEAAFVATSFHYGVSLPYLSIMDLRTQRRVMKDVKAVLLGNRTAAQLHEAWAQRKIRSLPYSKVVKNYPSALQAFHYLPKEDQEGYRLFVKTVLDTYKKSKPVASEKSVADLLLRCQGAELIPKQDGKAMVLVRFEKYEDAEAFYRRTYARG